MPDTREPDPNAIMLKRRKTIQPIRQYITEKYGINGKATPTTASAAAAATTILDLIQDLETA